MAQEFALLGVSGGSGSTVLILDTMGSGNVADLQSHSQDIGPGWTEVVHGFDKAAGRAHALGAPGLDVTDASQSDVTVKWTAALGVADSVHAVGGVLRETDVNNYWLCHPDGSGGLFIYEVAAGTATQRASGSWSADTNDHQFQAQASGSTISFRVDGGTAISYGSATSNQSATKHGIRGFSTGTADSYGRFEVDHP